MTPDEIARKRAIAAVLDESFGSMEESMADISYGLDLEKQREKEAAVVHSGEDQPVGSDFVEKQAQDSQSSLLEELLFQDVILIDNNEKKNIGSVRDSTEKKTLMKSHEDKLVLPVEKEKARQVTVSREPTPSGRSSVDEADPTTLESETGACAGEQVAPPHVDPTEATTSSQQALPGAYSAGFGTQPVRNEAISFALVGLTGSTGEETEDIEARSGRVSAVSNSANIRDRPLATANLVSEDDIVDPEDLTRADPVSPDALERPKTRALLGKITLYAMLLVVSVPFVLSFLVWRRSGAEREPAGPSQAAQDVASGSPTMSPTAQVLAPCIVGSTNFTSEDLSLLQQIISEMPSYIAEHTLCNTLGDTPSPQSKALEWVLKDPNLPLLPLWRIRQRFVLAVLFFTTQGEEWLRSDNWLSYEEDECFWLHASERLHFGNVVFDNHPPCGADYNRSSEEGGVYKHLWLEAVGMNGTLPLELFAMTSLEILSMASVGHDVIMDMETGLPIASYGSSPYGLTGPVPTELGLLTNLHHVFLNENKFSSTMPSEIGLLTNLKGLDFKFNYDLTGRLPKEIGHLTLLETLDLVETNLIGPAFTKELLQLTNLMFLHLGGSAFEGSIPTEIGALSSLINLEMSDQFLTGPVPSELGNLPNLQMLSLGENQFTGTIPTELGLCSSLLILSLEMNIMSGSIPTEVAGLPRMSSFQLGSNRLTGTIPTEIGLQNMVYWLDLSSNYLTGSLPSGEYFQNYVFLHLLFLDNNPQLTGAFPEELLTISSAYRLKLENTGISGTIPSHLCRLEDRLEFRCEPDVICGCDCPCPDSSNYTGDALD